MNQSLSEMFGYSREEVLGKSIFQLAIPKEYHAEVTEYFKSRSVDPYEMEVVKKDGSRFPAEIIAKEVMIDGTTLRVAAVRDITERKETEEALKESEELLRQTQRIAKLGGWEYDVANQKIIWTDEVYEIYGVDKDFEPSDAEKIAKFFHPEDQKTILDAFSDAIKGEPYDLELRFINQQGKHLWVRTVAHPIKEDGKIVKIQGNFADITERKQAEKALKESEDFLNRTGEIARVGGWYLSDSFDKVYWTKTTGRIHELPDGYFPSLEEAINYYHPDDQALVRESVESAIKDGKPFDFETRLKTAKGNEVWVQALGQPEMKDGKCVRLSGTFQDITERRKAEEALKQSEKKFRSYVDNSPDGVFIANEKGRYVDVNPAASKITGYSREELLDLSIPDLLQPDYIEKGIKSFQELAEQGSIRVDLGFVTKSGENRFWEVAATKLSDTRFLGFTKDITESKKAEEELKASEEKYRNLAENTSDLIATIDLKGNVTYMSRAAEDESGYSVEEIEKMNIRDLLTEESSKLVMEMVQQRLSGIHRNTPFEIDILHKKGFPIPFEIKSTSISENDTIIGFQVVARNITDRKLAEEALIESEEKYKSIVESSIQGLVIAQSDPIRLSFASAPMESITGYTPEELMNFGTEQLQELIYADDRQRFFSSFQKRLEGKDIKQRSEYRINHKDGSLRWVELFSSLISFNGESATQTVFVDITERKKAEEALMESEERFKTLSNLTFEGILIHDNGIIVDLNQSLSEMFGYSREEVLGKSIFQLAIPKEYHAEVAEYIKSRSVDPYEMEVIKKDGSRFPAEIVAKDVMIEDSTLRVAAIRDVTELKKAYMFADKIAETTPAMLYIYDFEQQKNIWSNTVHDNYFKKLVKNYAEMRYKNVAEITHKDDFARILEKVEEMSKNVKVNKFDLDIRIKSTDGEWKWMTLLNSVFQRDENGKLLQTIGALFDITERKLAEEKLKKSEQYFKDLTENSSDIIIVVNRSGVIQYASSSMKRFMGYDPEELIGHKVFKYIHKADLPRAVKDFGKAVLTKDSSVHNSFRVLHKDGSVRILEGYGKSLFNNPFINGFVMNIHDATEREKAEIALRESEKSLRDAQRIANIGNWTLDLATGDVHMSDEMFHVIGIDKNAGLDVSQHEKYYTPESWQHFQKAVKEAQEEGKSYEIELEFASKNTEFRYAIARGEPVYDNNNKIIALKGTLQDITERKVAEEKIEKELRENRLLLSEIHHRVKNNLQTLSGLLQLQQDLIETKEDAIKAFEASQDRIMAMARAYELLLHSEHMSDVNVPEYIESIVRQLKFSYDPESRVFVEYDLENCEMEIQELSKTGLIINELVTNVFKYAFQGREQGKLWLSVKEKNDRIYFDIADDGVGLPKDIDFEGTDTLGLSLVSMMISELKGKLTYKVDNGTRFIIEIPKGTKKLIQR